MIMRSTGLGKAELIGDVTEIKSQGDYLIMEMHTTTPVRWKIRVGLSRKDLASLLKMMLKMSLIAFILNVQGWFKEPVHPGDY